jgi:hypothetical protein
VATLVTPAHNIASLIEELPVRCPHGVTLQPGGAEDDWVVARGGCDAVVPRGELAAHTASCPFEPVGCAQAEHGCAWRGARRGLVEHAGSCWYEQGRELVGRVAELVNANAAAAEKAVAELAKVRAEAAAQLAALRAALKAEVAAVKRESAAQVRKTPSWPNFSLLLLHSHWNARANSHLLGLDTLLAAVGGAAPADRAGGGGAGLDLTVALY